MNELHMTRRTRWVFVLVGSLVMPWAFPATSIGWFAIAGVAALIAAVHRQRCSVAASMGLVFGFVWGIISLKWAIVISPIAWIGLSAIMAFWSGVFAASTAIATRRRWWVLVVPTVWVATEQLRCLVPWGGFPWLRLSFVGGMDPLLPASWLVSTAGMSWLVAAASAAVVYLVMAGATARSLVPLGAVTLAAAALTTTSLFIQRHANVIPAVIGYVQPSQTKEEILDASKRSLLLEDTLQGLSSAGTQIQGIRAHDGDIPAVLALAEDALPGTVWTDPAVNLRLQSAVDSTRSSVLAGFVIWTDDGKFLLNRAALWQTGRTTGADDASAQFYDKRHLVPFGEWVPFRDITESWVPRLAWVQTDFVSGKQPGVFVTAEGTTIGTVICFETAYDDVTRDVATSDVLTVQTNNSAFLGTEQPAQQFAISKARAAEAGRPLVVSAATGVSGIVDSRGRVVPGTLTTGNVRAAVVRTMPVGGLDAPALKFGPYLRWSSVLVLALVWMLWSRARRRTVDDERPS